MIKASERVLFSYNSVRRDVKHAPAYHSMAAKRRVNMAGIFTRGALDKIIRNGELTEEQKIEQLFALYGRALDDGFISKTAAEEAKNAAIEAAKAGIKVPDPVDPKTTPEYLDLLKERDMLRAVGGDEFQKVKPKFRETVFGMLDRGEKAAAVADQLTGIKEKYEEYFMPDQEPTKDQPKNTPQYSQQPGHSGTNPTSEEDKLFKQLSESWK